MSRSLERHSRLDRASLFGLCLLLFASTLNGLTKDVRLGNLTLTIRPDQLVMIFLAPILIASFSRQQSRWQRTALDLPVLGFLVTNGISSVAFSPLKGMSLQGVVLLTVYAAMYFAVVTLCTAHPEWHRTIICVALGLPLLHSAYGLVTFFAYSRGCNLGGIHIGQVTATSVSVKSTFWEANLYGIYLAVMAAPWSALLLLGEPAKVRWIAGVSLTWIMTSLVLSFTRSAWLALAGTLFALTCIAASRFRNLRAVASRTGLLVTVLAIVAALSAAILNPTASLLWGEDDVLGIRLASLSLVWSSTPTSSTSPADAAPDSTGAGASPADAAPDSTGAAASPAESGAIWTAIGRLDLYKRGFTEALKKPILGHGTFAGEAIGNRYWMSSIVQSLYDTGIVGTIFLLWMHMAAGICSWNSYRREREAIRKALLLALALANGALVFMSQFSSCTWVGFSWVFLGLSVGLSCGRRETCSGAM